MTTVRRCDNPACTNGAAGTVAVSDTANPDGWITATSSPIVGGQSQPLDFDTALCAAQALYGSDVDVAPAGTIAALQKKPSGTTKT